MKRNGLTLLSNITQILTTYGENKNQKMCSVIFQSLFGESVVWDDDTIFDFMDLRVAVLNVLNFLIK